MNRGKNQSGQSIIEVVVALLVVGLIAIGLVRISSLSLKNARFANEETEAVSLAEKKIAEIKVNSVNETDFWTKLPYQDSGLANVYCYLTVVTRQALPTDTTPRYGEADMGFAKVIIYWGLKGNEECSTEETGANNYDHKIDITTLLVK